MLLFVDPYTGVEFTQNHVSAVSANYAKMPLILITSKDKAKEYIAAHEILHGLGKALHSSVPSAPGKKVVFPAPSDPFFSGYEIATWNESLCKDDMLNPTDLSSAMSKASIDWAAYYTYLNVAKTIK